MLAVPESWVKKALPMQEPRKDTEGGRGAWARGPAGWLHPSAAVRGPHSRGTTSRTSRLSDAISARTAGPSSPAPRLDPRPKAHSAVSLALNPVTY